jgi:pimeloyl-ACP methyl ester carboxylesterase
VRCARVSLRAYWGRAFPGEILASPRSWLETVYPDLAYFDEVDRGGHFAAWEEPELFAAEMRAAFSSLR